MVSTVQTLAILAVFAAVIVTVASSVAFSMAFMEWMFPSKDSTADRDAGTAFLAFFLSFVGVFWIAVAVIHSGAWTLPAVAYVAMLAFGGWRLRTGGKTRSEAGEGS